MSAKFEASATEQQDNVPLVPLQWPRCKHVMDMGNGEWADTVHNMYINIYISDMEIWSLSGV